MNILICVGKNYRDFEPLNAFALRFARLQFDKIDGIFFVDSTKELTHLKPKIRDFTQCLILADTNLFSQIKELFCNLESKINLIDLQQTNAQNTEPKQTKILYIYPLNMDSKSAEILLSGVAKDFGVEICALNCGNLEVLSACNGDLYGFEVAIKDMFLGGIFTSFNLAKSIIALLSGKCQKITTAESCTGGLIAHTLIKEDGASAVIDGATICYANSIKEAWLSVESSHLAQFGAVSEAVVSDMLDGALRLSAADFAIATSGIAGPSGGSKEKPVGTVYIGVKSANGEAIIERLNFKGDRNFIQAQATMYALLLFLKIFLKNP